MSLCKLQPIHLATLDFRERRYIYAVLAFPPLLVAIVYILTATMFGSSGTVFGERTLEDLGLKDSLCSFSSEREFGKYVKVAKRNEYYSKRCPLAARRFKKCFTEGYQWQPPYDCELLEISAFTRYFRNRTLILWGDSISEQLSGSLLCMLSDRKIWHEKDASAYIKLMRKRRYCFTVSNNIKICYVYSSNPKKHLEQILELQNKEALVVANFGLHYNINKTQKDELALKGDIEEFITELSKFTSKLIWRETSAQHFPTEDGSFSSHVKKNSGKASKCVPVRKQTRGWRNDITTPLMQNATPYVLRIGAFSSSIPPSLHRSEKDCTHFCNPGVTDDWSRILMNYIYAHNI